ncbi:MAG: DNA primase [Acidimicrobiaceae bacterium]|nr:DNA primase [Acidimicrobiaceae bacterium]MYG54886.1 DNA primase [Acidimicrobiaceae bacterium]MYJ98509.1 DNA primase [Acidimicrobiaceae bacterium]
MGIHDDDIAKVRASADLVALIGEHTDIKRSGRNWMARCPLHGERTPSLSVNAEKGVYYCFGCQRSGDAITFVQEIEKLDFVGAVESLASRYGVQLRYTTQGEGTTRARKRVLLDAVAKAVDFYHQRLLDSPDAGAARGYLRSRGYDRSVVSKYKLGWAPDSWDELAKHLRLNAADLKDSGLGFVNKADRPQDAFRARIMFPIADERGDFTGFGGRILPGQEGPKYKNTIGEAVVYDKSKLLYGLHAHRQGIVKEGEAIICEGYTDVIGFANANILRAVATCGTALTEEHIKLLKRFSANRLVLAFDTDSAGLAAAERVYEWEQQFELDVRVADLPPGVDPDDVAREDPAELARAVREAIPYMRFRMGRALSAGDLSSPEGRARAAERAVDVVSEHPNELVRDPYLEEIAQVCRVDVARLRELASKPRPKPQAQRRGAHQGRPHGRTQQEWADHEVPNAPDEETQSTSPEASLTDSLATAAEDEALRLVIDQPDQAARLHANLFGHSVRQEAFQALRDHGFEGAADHCGPQAADLLRRLAVEGFDADRDDVLAGVARLAGRRTLDGISRGLRSYEAAAEARIEVSRSFTWLKRELEKLDERETRRRAIDELLPWLVSHAEWRAR